MLTSLLVSAALLLPSPAQAQSSTSHHESAWHHCRVHLHQSARTCTWRSRYLALPSGRRAYVRALFNCEGGKLPYDADGSGFRYRGEWAARTWANAGGSPVPRPSYYEEAVRTSRTLDKVGFHTTAGWPNCPR